MSTKSSLFSSLASKYQSRKASGGRVAGYGHSALPCPILVYVCK